MINVSIVLYNTPEKEIINTVTIFSESKIIANIFLVDNSLIDKSSQLMNRFAKVRYSHNPSNPGYGASHNVGIRESLSTNIKYHLVANSDINFNPTILESMYKFMEANKDVGLLSPKILNTDGSIQYNCKLIPNPLNMLLRAFLPRKIRMVIGSDSSYQLEHFGYDKQFEVPYVSGCFMFLRTDDLRKTGCFDERFFMYPEDIDLSRRIASVSRVLFNPEFVITHYYGGETHKKIKSFLIHTFNMFKYFNKWGWFFDNSRKTMNQRTLQQFDKR